MGNESFPILNIKHFQDTSDQESFYANIFSNHLRCNHTEITTPHKHDFYLSVCFTHGQGTHEIDFQTFPITAGSLYFLHPGQTHSWKLSDDIEGYIFFHSRNFYDSQYARKSITDFPLYHSSRFPPFLQLDPDQTQKAIDTFQSLLSEYPIPCLAKAEKVCSLLDVFYLDLSEQLIKLHSEAPVQPHTYTSKINQLEQLIEHHFKHEKLPRVYAQKMNMTSKHLNRICKSTLGKTTSELINARLLLESKRMLVHTDHPLSFAAYALGFKDYAYFSRWFKQQTGKT
ncbi:MAG: AraC-like DNA-binding protein, partial [Halieaceae bacterium]